MVKNRTVFTKVEPLHLRYILVLLIRSYLGQEGNVVLAVELCELLVGARSWTKNLQVFVKVISENEIVSHAEAMGLHGMVRSVIISTNLLIIVVANSFFSDHEPKLASRTVGYPQRQSPSIRRIFSNNWVQNEFNYDTVYTLVVAAEILMTGNVGLT